MAADTCQSAARELPQARGSLFDGGPKNSFRKSRPINIVDAIDISKL
jgi:hypothetical protein